MKRKKKDGQELDKSKANVWNKFYNSSIHSIRTACSCTVAEN